MISRLGMLAPLVAVLAWADRKLNIGGRVVSPAGPQMDCSRRGHRQPGIRLTGVRRAPYSIRGAAEKADISVIPGPSQRARAKSRGPMTGSARSPESISQSPRAVSALPVASLFVVMDSGLAALRRPGMMRA